MLQRRGKENEDGLIDGREGMEEGRGDKELGKGEYLESDCEEIWIIYPVTKAACFELYALHLDSLCLDQVLKSKISKVSSKDPMSFEAIRHCVSAA